MRWLAKVGWDIDFVVQPPNLPDTNTLDLAFFQVIQLLQYQKDVYNLNELIANVKEAYVNLPLDICQHVWLMVQIVMNSILLCDGINNYMLPHI